MLVTPDESQQHIVIAEDELLELPLPTYRCEICGFCVKTKANLRAHHVKTHKILKNDSDVAFLTKRKRQVTYVYHCPIVPCKHNIGFGAGFSTSSRLKQHYQNVHMHRSFKCDRCGDLFATPSIHAYHVRFCGKVFSCPICSRRYSFKKHLDQHFRRSGHRSADKPARRSKNRTNDRDACAFKQNKAGTENAPLVDTHCVMPNPVASSVPSQTMIVPLVLVPLSVCGMNNVGLQNPKGDMCDNQLEMSTRYSSIALPANMFLTLSMGNPGAAHSAQPAAPALTILPQVHLNTSMCGARPLVDSSTQTEWGTPSADTVATDPFINTVSVNTCTDEDDISEFLGSLFCDAGVEASFPIPHLLDRNDFTASGSCDPAVTGTYRQPQTVTNVTSLNGSSVPLDSSTALCRPGDLFTFSPVDEEIQTNVLHSFEHASMQTDVVTVTHAAAATHDYPIAHWNRPLETPPLPVGMHVGMPSSAAAAPQTAGSASLVRFSPTKPHRFASDTPLGSETCISTIDLFLNDSAYGYSGSNDYSQAIDLKSSSPNSPESLVPGLPVTRDCNNCYLPSSHSIGLQSSSSSSSWLPDRLCSSIASQTTRLSDDLESWLNSVHTQTSTSPFGHQSFTDMCVGVEDGFLDAALNSLDATTDTLTLDSSALSFS